MPSVATEEGNKVSRWEPLHLLALSGLAVAQPLFDLLGRTPEFFVTRHCRAPDVWLFAGLVFLGLPLGLAALAELAGRLFGPRTRRLALAGLLGLGAGLLVLQALRRLPAATPAAAAVTVAVAGAGLFALGWLRIRVIRQFVALLALVVWAVPVLFLGRAPVRRLLVPGSGPEPAAGGRPVGNPCPVVMVVFDELPTTSLMNAEGQVDATLFPHFAALAETATWFHNATTVASLTEQAIPAMLTARYPRSGQLPTLRDHPRNLFTLLAGSYDFYVVEPRTELCPLPWRSARTLPFADRFGLLLSDLGIVYLHLVLPPSWAAGLPQVTTGWEGFGRLPDEGRRFREFIAGIRPGPRPGLYFLHSLLPHAPWIYLPSGTRYDPETGPIRRRPVVRGRWVDREWPIVQAYQRHLLQLCFTDQLLGSLWDRLRELDLFDRALVVVTADHGIGFEPGAYVRYGDGDSYSDVISVPLFVKLPGQREGRISERRVELIDVLPTVAEVLDLPLEGPLDGRSLLAPEVPGRRTFLYNSETSHGWIDGLPLDPRDRTLRRKLAYFGSDAGPAALYRLGPHADRLLGRALPELTLAAGRPWTAELDRSASFQAVDRAGEVVPARVTGRLLDAPESAETAVLALAVNGTVEAISLTLGTADPDGEFSFMVPEEAFRDGGNHLALFRVEATGGEPLLVPIALSAGVSWVLEAEAGAARRIRSSAGRIWEVTAELDGEVIGIYAGNFRVEVVGWAHHRTTGELPEKVLAFVDGELVHAGELNLPAAELGSRYQVAFPDHPGFGWFLQAADLEGDVRFVAIAAGGVASELPYRPVRSQQAPPEWD